MKKQFLSIITATAMTLSILPISAYAYSKDGDFSSDLEYTYEKYGKEKLWDNFIKYDLRISDYDSLTDDEKELCKYIFETEMNSEVDIVCERARRILAGYDVGERITIDELSQYEFIGDYNIYYNYCISDNDELYAPYSDIMTRHCVPDIRHISENYSEYWTDDEKTTNIEALGDCFESFENKVMYDSMYLYDESLDGGEVYSGFDYFNDLEFETFESDGLKYMIYPDNTLTVIGVDKNAETISVPESVEDKTVTKIKSDAFRDSAVEEIILPETVKYIEPFAFRECRKLKSINIPNNTECLGYGAFDSCESLKQLEINCPKLYLQKTELFNNCNIEELKINVKSVPYFSQGNIEKIVFGADVKDIEISYLNGDYEIPENVKVAFANKMPKEYDFSELTVPKSIEIFGAYCPKKNADLFSSLNGYAYIPLLDENYTLYGYTGTSAEEYAKEFDIPFVALDEKAEEIKGDANCDGNVNMADAVLIMQSLANPDKYGVNGTDDTHITAQGEKNGDMDGNGLTNADALAIQKKILKIDTDRIDDTPSFLIQTSTFNTLEEFEKNEKNIKYYYIPSVNSDEYKLSKVTKRDNEYVMTEYRMVNPVVSDELSEYDAERLQTLICRYSLNPNGAELLNNSFIENGYTAVECDGKTYYRCDEHADNNPDKQITGYETAFLQDGKLIYMHIPAVDTFENMIAFAELQKIEIK